MRIGKAGAFRHRLRTYVESVSDIFNRVMSLAEVFMKRKAILFLIVLTALALTGIVTACSLHEHTLERVKAVAPTCDMDGNSEYWRCTGCGKLFKDESASVEIADESSFSIAAKGHDLIQVEENPATCTNNGTRSYWICRTCGKMFGDAEGEHGLSEEDIVLTASGHFLYNHPAVAETCTEDGNIEYWTCNYCGKIFIDADATQQADGIEDVTIKAHHFFGDDLKYDDAGHWKECVLCGEKDIAEEHSRDANGVCQICGYEWTYTPGLRFKLVDGSYEVSLSGYNVEVTDVVIPATYNGIPVTQIAYGAFQMTNITSVRIPSSITCIKSNAFSITNSLREVYVDDIAAWCRIVFDGNYSNPLASGTLYVNGERADVLEIPDEVTSISEKAFGKCGEISAIVIGENLSTVGSYAFSGCDNLKTVYYKGTVGGWSGISFGIYNDALEDADVYYYSESDPFADGSVTEGKYWHYDDNGAPAVWINQ